MTEKRDSAKDQDIAHTNINLDIVLIYSSCVQTTFSGLPYHI